MKRAYKRTAKKILEDAKKELDSPEENASLEEWAAFVLKKYDEMERDEKFGNVKEEYLIHWLVRELFFTFEEKGLNKLIDSINSHEEREDQNHLDYDLTYEQADILGKIISQNFSQKSKEYLLKILIETKNTKKPPLSPYRKPSKKTCPNCDSVKFKSVQKEFLDAGTISKKVCLDCGYVHKKKKKEFESKFVGD